MVYFGWKRVGDVQLLFDGKYVVYIVKFFKGDGYLYLVNFEIGYYDLVVCGVDFVFLSLGFILVFCVIFYVDMFCKLELCKVKKEKWLKDFFFIYWMEVDLILKFFWIECFLVVFDGNFVVWLSVKNEYLSGYFLKRKVKKEEKKCRKVGFEMEGKVLFVWNFIVKKLFVYCDVDDFYWSYKGIYLVFIMVQIYKKVDFVQLNVYFVNMGGLF